jgi:prepilin-type N-terminal cleavage/methylation domain-containing protein
MRRDRGGFTLIELLVALAVGAAVLVGARGLLDGLGAEAGTIARAMRASDARANAERTARQVVGNVALAPVGSPTFVGGPEQASFDSACPSPRGGLEPCHVQLAVEHRAEGAVLTLTLSTGQSLTLLRGRSIGIRYLTDAAEGGQWAQQWSATQTPPLAVAASAGSEALFLRIGERR